MKRSLAATAVTAAMVLAGCSEREPAAEADAAGDVAVEAAGLKQINSMNRGDAQAYSAGDGANGRGQLMQVIATRIEGGPTDVQLDWTTGR